MWSMRNIPAYFSGISESRKRPHNPEHLDSLKRVIECYFFFTIIAVFSDSRNNVPLNRFIVYVRERLVSAPNAN